MQNSAPKQSWLNRTVLGVGLTSLFSDWSHETATAVLPAFLAAIGAGPAWLGAIEGIADGLSSFAKLAAGHFRSPEAPQATRRFWLCLHRSCDGFFRVRNARLSCVVWPRRCVAWPRCPLPCEESLARRRCSAKC